MRNPSELWAMDISEKQIEKAAEQLKARGLSAKLICSPMEKECGIPVGYFDYVYSIYAIGWTTDLEGTLSRIASYLKKDAVFIFSWSHPIHRCVASDNGMFTFKKTYFDENWYPVAVDEGELLLADRKLSTYVNALAKAGFVIEQMIEETDDEIMQTLDGNSDMAKRAKVLPVTFVIKARKL
ncbi:SAM-dependent methyltransferase [Paenibacillus sp. JGP012]|nr:SAM-dependent methyltransferase [Paenibacillus sp. JGP012]